MPELILFRHGRSRGNANKGVIQGSGPNPDNTLDEVGIAQAERCGRALKAEGVVPEGVWSSPLERARQTCDIVLGMMACDLLVTEDDRLREMCKGLEGLPGGMEGRRREDVETPEYWQQYREQGWKFRHGSVESKGETAEEVGLRELSVMNDIADHLSDDGTGLVFTHGQAIRYWVGAALGWPDIQQINKDFMLDNCEGVRARRDSGLWQVTGKIVTGQVA